MDLVNRLNLMNPVYSKHLEAIKDFCVKVWETPLLPWFTKHDSTHSDELIYILNQLLQQIEETPQALNDNELFVLLASAYLHDIGMQYAKVENKSLDTLTETDFESIRRAHANKTFELICNKFKDNTDRDSIQVPEIDDEFLSVIALISKGHSTENYLDIVQVFDTGSYRPKNRPFRGALLASLLLIADELDLHSKRVDFKETGCFTLSTTSKVHWFKHHYIDSVYVASGSINIGLRVYGDDERYISVLKGIVGAKLREQIELITPILSQYTNGRLILSPEIRFQVLRDITNSKRKMDDDVYAEMVNICRKLGADLPVPVQQANAEPIANTLPEFVAVKVEDGDKKENLIAETSGHEQLKKPSYKQKLNMIGNSKAQAELMSILTKWHTNPSNSGSIFVLGEEGTGKSMLISHALSKVLPEAYIIKFSGKSFSSNMDRFIFNVLGSLFAEDPNYDGKILIKLKDFCERNNLLSVRRLYKYLSGICEGQIQDDLSGAKFLTSLPSAESFVPDAQKNTINENKYSRTQFCQYTELWNVLKVFAVETNKAIVVWLEDAQLFAIDGSNMVISLCQNATESGSNVMLISEFRAERIVDSNKYKELYGKYCKNKMITCSNLSKDEMKDLVAEVMMVKKNKVKKDIINYLYEASGGNPKYVVDFLKFLVEQGAVKKEYEGVDVEDELVFNKPAQLVIPSELKSICKQRIKLYRPDTSELSVLLILAATDRSDLAVSLLNSIIQSSETAIKKLTEDLGVIKDSESIDCWKVKFEHLTAKDSCFELLQEQPKEFISTLLARIMEVMKSCDDKGSNQLLAQLRSKLAYYAEDADTLAESIVWDILNAKEKDLPHLKSCAKILLHKEDSSEFCHLVRYLALAKVAEIDQKEDVVSLYQRIFGLENYISNWNALFPHKAIVTALILSYVKSLSNNDDTFPDIWKRVCNLSHKLMESAPDFDLSLYSRQYLFSLFFKKLSACTLDNEIILRTIENSKCTHQLDDFSNIFVAFFASEILAADAKFTLTTSDYVDTLVLTILDSHRESLNSDYAIQICTQAGFKILQNNFIKICNAETASSEEVIASYNDVISYTENVNSFLAEISCEHSIVIPSEFTISYARRLCTFKDYEGAIRILTGIYDKGSSERFSVISELVNIEYQQLGSIVNYGDEFESMLSSLDSYESFPPELMPSIVNAMLAIDSIRVNDVKELIYNWIQDIPAKGYNLPSIINFFMDLVTIINVDVKRIFATINSKFRLKDYEKSLVLIGEQKVSSLSYDPNKNGIDFLVSKLNKLKDLYEGDLDLRSVTDFNLYDFITYVLADIALLIPADMPASSYWCKYAKRKLETLNVNPNDIHSTGYFRRRWQLMLHINEQKLAKEECENFLVLGDKQFAYEMLATISVPKCIGINSQNNFADGLRYGKIVNDLTPSSVNSILFFRQIQKEVGVFKDSDYEHRVDRCKKLLIDKSDYQSAFLLLNSYALYQFDNNELDNAFSTKQEAYGYLLKVVPPSINDRVDCQSELLFMHLSVSLQGQYRLSDIVESLNILIELLNDLEPSYETNGTLALASFNYCCAKLLATNEIAPVQTFLEDMLRSDDLKPKMHEKIGYLIMCRYNNNKVFGVQVRDLELEVAVFATLYNTYKSINNIPAANKMHDKLRALKIKYKISDALLLSIID